jgi:hypothetical protein
MNHIVEKEIRMGVHVRRRILLRTGAHNGRPIIGIGAVNAFPLVELGDEPSNV